MSQKLQDREKKRNEKSEYDIVDRKQMNRDQDIRISFR